MAEERRDVPRVVWILLLLICMGFFLVKIYTPTEDDDKWIGWTDYDDNYYVADDFGNKQDANDSNLDNLRKNKFKRIVIVSRNGSRGTRLADTLTKELYNNNLADSNTEIIKYSGNTNSIKKLLNNINNSKADIVLSTDTDLGKTIYSHFNGRNIPIISSTVGRDLLGTLGIDKNDGTDDKVFIDTVIKNTRRVMNNSSGLGSGGFGTNSNYKNFIKNRNTNFNKGLSSGSGWSGSNSNYWANIGGNIKNFYILNDMDIDDSVLNDEDSIDELNLVDIKNKKTVIVREKGQRGNGMFAAANDVLVKNGQTVLDENVFNIDTGFVKVIDDFSESEKTNKNWTTWFGSGGSSGNGQYFKVQDKVLAAKGIDVKRFIDGWIQTVNSGIVCYSGQDRTGSASLGKYTFNPNVSYMLCVENIGNLDYKDNIKYGYTEEYFFENHICTEWNYGFKFGDYDDYNKYQNYRVAEEQDLRNLLRSSNVHDVTVEKRAIEIYPFPRSSLNLNYESFFTADNSTCNDYTISVDIALNRGPEYYKVYAYGGIDTSQSNIFQRADAGIVFRKKDESNFYLLSIGNKHPSRDLTNIYTQFPDQIELFKCEEGIFKFIESMPDNASINIPIDNSTNIFYRYVLKIEGNQFNLEIYDQNNTYLARKTFTDPTNTFDKGTVALRVRNGTEAKFKNFSCTSVVGLFNDPDRNLLINEFKDDTYIEGYTSGTNWFVDSNSHSLYGYANPSQNPSTIKINEDGSFDWDNISIDVDVDIPKDMAPTVQSKIPNSCTNNDNNIAAGITFRTQQEGKDYYLLEITPKSATKHNLYKVSNNVKGTSIAHSIDSGRDAFEQGTAYSYKIMLDNNTSNGSYIKIYKNNVLLMEYKNELDLKFGTIGFYVSNNAYAKFDNLIVSSMEGIPQFGVGTEVDVLASLIKTKTPDLVLVLPKDSLYLARALTFSSPTFNAIDPESSDEKYKMMKNFLLSHPSNILVKFNDIIKDSNAAIDRKTVRLNPSDITKENTGRLLRLKRAFLEPNYTIDDFINRQRTDANINDFRFNENSIITFTANIDSTRESDINIDDTLLNKFRDYVRNAFRSSGTADANSLEYKGLETSKIDTSTVSEPNKLEFNSGEKYLDILTGSDPNHIYIQKHYMQGEGITDEGSLKEFVVRRWNFNNDYTPKEGSYSNAIRYATKYIYLRDLKKLIVGNEITNQIKNDFYYIYDKFEKSRTELPSEKQLLIDYPINDTQWVEYYNNHSSSNIELDSPVSTMLRYQLEDNGQTMPVELSDAEKIDKAKRDSNSLVVTIDGTKYIKDTVQYLSIVRLKQFFEKLSANNSNLYSILKSLSVVVKTNLNIIDLSYKPPVVCMNPSQGNYANYDGTPNSTVTGVNSNADNYEVKSCQVLDLLKNLPEVTNSNTNLNASLMYYIDGDAVKDVPVKISKSSLNKAVKKYGGVINNSNFIRSNTYDDFSQQLLNMGNRQWIFFGFPYLKTSPNEKTLQQPKDAIDRMRDKSAGVDKIPVFSLLEPAVSRGVLAGLTMEPNKMAAQLAEVGVKVLQRSESDNKKKVRNVKVENLKDSTILLNANTLLKYKGITNFASYGDTLESNTSDTDYITNENTINKILTDTNISKEPSMTLLKCDFDKNPIYSWKTYNSGKASINNDSLFSEENYYNNMLGITRTDPNDPNNKNYIRTDVDYPKVYNISSTYRTKRGNNDFTKKFFSVVGDNLNGNYNFKSYIKFMPAKTNDQRGQAGIVLGYRNTGNDKSNCLIEFSNYPDVGIKILKSRTSGKSAVYDVVNANYSGDENVLNYIKNHRSMVDGGEKDCVFEVDIHVENGNVIINVQCGQYVKLEGTSSEKEFKKFDGVGTYTIQAVGSIGDGRIGFFSAGMSSLEVDDIEVTKKTNVKLCRLNSRPFSVNKTVIKENTDPQDEKCFEVDFSNGSAYTIGAYAVDLYTIRGLWNVNFLGSLSSFDSYTNSYNIPDVLQIAMVRNQSYSNFVYEAEFNKTDGKYGVVFLSDYCGANSYSVMIDKNASNISLNNIQNNKISEIQSTPLPSGGAEPYSIKIRCIDKLVEVFVGTSDTACLKYDISSVSSYGKGTGFGLVTSRGNMQCRKIKISNGDNAKVENEPYGAYAAYALKKIRNGYPAMAPAIKIVTSASDSGKDIGFNGNSLDIEAIKSYAVAKGATSVYVKTLYDQSGNKRNMTQDVFQNMPKIMDGNSIILDNNEPVLRFDIDDKLGISSTLEKFDYMSMKYKFKPDLAPAGGDGWRPRVYAGGSWNQFCLHASPAGILYAGTNVATRIQTEANKIQNGKMQEIIFKKAKNEASVYSYINESGAIIDQCIGTKIDMADSSSAWNGLYIEGNQDFSKLILYNRTINDYPDEFNANEDGVYLYEFENYMGKCMKIKKDDYPKFANSVVLSTADSNYFNNGKGGNYSVNFANQVSSVKIIDSSNTKGIGFGTAVVLSRGATHTNVDSDNLTLLAKENITLNDPVDAQIIDLNKKVVFSNVSSSIKIYNNIFDKPLSIKHSYSDRFFTKSKSGTSIFIHDPNLDSNYSQTFKFKNTSEDGNYFKISGAIFSDSNDLGDAYIAEKDPWNLNAFKDSSGHYFYIKSINGLRCQIETSPIKNKSYILETSGWNVKNGEPVRGWSKGSQQYLKINILP